MKDEEFDLFKKRIRGVRRNKKSFPIDYAPPIRETFSMSKAQFRRPPEAVFKIASYIKTNTEAQRAAAYIIENSEGLKEPIKLYDEERCELDLETSQRKLNELDFDADRKNSRKMIHFIVSFPKQIPITETKAKQFMAQYMEPFAQQGYAYMFGVHTHQSNVHGHVLMALSNEQKQKLDFRKPQIMMMRQHQAEIAKNFGWQMSATRCKDRQLSIDGIFATPKRKTLLERQVPNWCKKRKSEHQGVVKKYDINEEAQTTLSAWSGAFDNPTKAEQLFIEMYAENKKTAFWYANHKPDVFGNLNTPPTTKLSERGFKAKKEEIRIDYSQKTTNLYLER